jgi:hypothetical protein
MTPSQFLIRLATGATVALVSAGFVVWIDDPFSKFTWRSRNLEDVTTGQSLGELAGWKAKTVLSRAYAHNAIVIGTSKLLDVDPKDLAFFNFFNSSLAAISLDDVSDYVDSLDNDIKLVVMGIDFFQFNENFLPTPAERDHGSP